MAKFKMAQVIYDCIYPVGSIYCSMSSTNPGTLFGGTWTQISGYFLYCTTTSKTTGGANSVSYTPVGTIAGHAITISEMPKHTHPVSNYNPGGYNLTNTLPFLYNDTKKGWPGSLYTEESGGDQPHTHTFTGTKATINTTPKYMSCYAWYRTA